MSWNVNRNTEDKVCEKGFVDILIHFDMCFYANVGYGLIQY